MDRGQYVTKSCLECKNEQKKCSEEIPCKRCLKHGRDCDKSWIPKKRGPKKKTGDIISYFLILNHKDDNNANDNDNYNNNINKENHVVNGAGCGDMFPNNPLSTISSEDTDFNQDNNNEENNMIDEAGYDYMFPDNPLSAIPSGDANFNQGNPLPTIPSGDANFNQGNSLPTISSEDTDFNQENNITDGTGLLYGYDIMFPDNPLSTILSEYVDFNQDQKNYHNNNGNDNNNNNEENNITDRAGFLYGYDGISMFSDNPLSTILSEYVGFNQDNNDNNGNNNNNNNEDSVIDGTRLLFGCDDMFPDNPLSTPSENVIFDQDSNI